MTARRRSRFLCKYFLVIGILNHPHVVNNVLIINGTGDTMPILDNINETSLLHTYQALMAEENKSKHGKR